MPQDEQAPKKGPQAADAGEVEDMFADTDTGSVPSPEAPTQPETPSGDSAAGAPKTDASPDQTGGEVPTVGGGGGIPWKPLFIILGVLIVVIGAAVISFYILSSRDSVTPEAPMEVEEEPVSEEQIPPSDQEDEPAEPDEQDQEEDEPTEDPEPTTDNADQEDEAPEADQDKDGLSDVQEAELGTSPTNPDTDGDGLFDREEVEVYGTDPLDPDTDGDGYSDGEEVDAGYNPDGPGELREIPE